MIIANLALTDLLAGCISLPCYSAMCIMQITGKDPCFMVHVSTPIVYILGVATFLITVFQAVERFIAIFYPFEYTTRFTNSAVIITSIVIWLVPCAGVIFWVLSRDTRSFNIILGVVLFTFTGVDIFCYVRIFLQTRKVETAIADQKRISGRDSERKPKTESKVARVTAMIMVNVLLCYTPQIGHSVYGLFPGEKPPESHYFLYWSWLFALVNSFINPLITFLQLSVIRNAAFGLERVSEISIAYSQAQQ